MLLIYHTKNEIIIRDTANPTIDIARYNRMTKDGYKLSFYAMGNIGACTYRLGFYSKDKEQHFIDCGFSVPQSQAAIIDMPNPEKITFTTILDK